MDAHARTTISLIAVITICIAVIALFLFWFGPISEDRASDTTAASPGQIEAEIPLPPPAVSPEILTQTYAGAMQSMRARLEAAEGPAVFSTLTSIEQEFFTIRVPEDKRDAHLNTFIGIKNFIERKDTLPPEEARSQALGFLSQLVDL